MSCSCRSMFFGTSDPNQTSDTAASDPVSNESSDGIASPFAMSPASAPPLNSSLPFGAPLFKTAPGENHSAQPVQQSPFSVTPSTGTGSPLTVGDVLPQLPKLNHLLTQFRIIQQFGFKRGPLGGGHRVIQKAADSFVVGIHFLHRHSS